MSRSRAFVRRRERRGCSSGDARRASPAWKVDVRGGNLATGRVFEHPGRGRAPGRRASRAVRRATRARDARGRITWVCGDARRRDTVDDDAIARVGGASRARGRGPTHRFPPPQPKNPETRDDAGARATTHLRSDRARKNPSGGLVCRPKVGDRTSRGWVDRRASVFDNAKSEWRRVWLFARILNAKVNECMRFGEIPRRVAGVANQEFRGHASRVRKYLRPAFSRDLDPQRTTQQICSTAGPFEEQRIEARD